MLKGKACSEKHEKFSLTFSYVKIIIFATYPNLTHFDSVVFLEKETIMLRYPHFLTNLNCFVFLERETHNAKNWDWEKASVKRWKKKKKKNPHIYLSNIRSAILFINLHMYVQNRCTVKDVQQWIKILLFCKCQEPHVVVFELVSWLSEVQDGWEAEYFLCIRPLWETYPQPTFWLQCVHLTFNIQVASWNPWHQCIPTWCWTKLDTFRYKILPYITHS